MSSTRMSPISVGNGIECQTAVDGYGIFHTSFSGEDSSQAHIIV